MVIDKEVSEERDPFGYIVHGLELRDTSLEGGWRSQ